MAHSITLQNLSDTDIINNDILGQICFAAPNEAGGTDSILVSASIFARSEGTFAADNNATELVFVTGASESAAPGATNYDMTLSSGGNLTLAGNLELGHASDTTIARSSAGVITVEGTEVILAGAVTGITSLLATDIKIGEDDQTKIDFETADEIHFYAANVHQVKLVDNAFTPQADSDVDLGASGTYWKDAFIDTITTTGDVDVLGNIELGHASDTTIARASAGQITVEGTAVILAGAVTGITSLLATDIKIGEDDQTKIDFETANQINFYADNTKRVTIDSTGLTVDSGSIETATIDYTDGDNAMTIADGGGVTFPQAATFSKAVKTPLKSNTDGSTVTFDLDEASTHTVTLGDNRTLAISNEDAGQKFIINLVQDGTGSRTVTWFSTIKWAGGSAPTLTTTANKADSFGFLCTGTDAYYGFVIGQNI